MKILVVDDDELTRISVKTCLERSKVSGLSGHQVKVSGSSTLTEATACLESEIFDAAFIDVALGPHHKTGGVELLQMIRQRFPTTVPIIMTSVEDYEILERCLWLGAADYIFKPFDYQKAHLILIKALSTHRQLRREQSLKAQAGEKAVTPIFLSSKSPKYQKVLDLCERIRGTNVSVLLLGETGVGKEVIARYLWTLEGDESRPFSAVHSAGMPKDLVESELFGHAKGAFTGANDKKIGKFQFAHGGDFFLDEIAIMPLRVQETLLRVLQERKVTPIGSNSSIAVDCRVICATNEDPELLVKKGTFREDLYYRIKGAVLRIPPLRERKEDLPDLVDFFLKKASLGRKHLTSGASRLCLSYDWPGNVRELENALCTVAAMARGQQITEEDLSTQIFSSNADAKPALEPPAVSSRDDGTSRGAYGLTTTIISRNFKRLSVDFEQTMVKLALKHAGSETAAADYLGLPRSTLVSRRKTWGWKAPEGMTFGPEPVETSTENSRDFDRPDEISTD